jgi:hypothetical protein
VNTLFWKILVTRVKRILRAIGVAEFLAFLEGDRAVGVDGTGSTQEEEVRLKSAYKD